MDTRPTGRSTRTTKCLRALRALASRTPVSSNVKFHLGLKYFVDTINMLTWDETKRKLNVKNHGLDFVGCDAIWDHFTVTREDKRQDYGEERLVCFGLLGADVVVMVYTERSKGPQVISLRKAEKHEARYYRQVAKENLG